MTAGAPRALRFTLTSGLTLVADGYGDPNKPPILLLHGGGQTRNAWGKTALKLAEAGFYAIALDQRGHGESDWEPNGLYDPQLFADDVSELIERIERPAVLVGASLGGISILTAEGQAASIRAAGVVLVDVTPRLAVVGVARVLDFMKARPDGFADLEEVAAAVASYMPHRPRPKDTSGLERNLRRGPDGRYRWHWDPRVLDAWDPSRFTEKMAQDGIAARLAAAARISAHAPLMLVRGRMSDVVTEENARELLNAAPATEYVDLKDAGHMVAGDVNDVFTEVVVDFVQRAHQR